VPRQGVATCTRPDSDIATKLGSMALSRSVSYLRIRGFYIDDLYGDRAVRDSVTSSIARNDPALFFGVGHGKEDLFTGQNQQVIFRVCEPPETIRGRVVYLLSCLTGAQLGVDMVNKGAETFIGYREEFVWVQERMVNPLDDRIGRAFFEPVEQIIRSLADGRTTGDAYRASIDRWNYWIDYWSRQGTPEASIVVMFLVHDRDCQVLYGSTTAVVAPAYAPAPPPLPLAVAEALTALTPFIIPVAGIGIAATRGTRT